jgi:hypothetical protein
MKINEMGTVYRQDSLQSVWFPKLRHTHGHRFTQAFRVNAGVFGPGSIWNRAMECTMKRSSRSNLVYGDFGAARSCAPIAGMP